MTSQFWLNFFSFSIIHWLTFFFFWVDQCFYFQRNQKISERILDWGQDPLSSSLSAPHRGGHSLGTQWGLINTRRWIISLHTFCITQKRTGVLLLSCLFSGKQKNFKPESTLVPQYLSEKEKDTYNSVHSTERKTEVQWGSWPHFQIKLQQR